jgi:AAA+ ATPase superfamily predicted ATPase
LIIDGTTALLNNNNILITGSRGMGKSSLANQFFYIARGDNSLIDKFRIKLGDLRSMDYAVISIRAFKESTINDIAGNIVRELVKKYQLDKQKEIQHEMDLKIYKLKMKTFTSEVSMDKLVDIFNYDIIKIHDHLGTRNGILILIDEIENINPETGFANFVKNVTEYFATEGKRINFLLAGIPSAITKLLSEHLSFSRLFTPLEVAELAPIELYELVDTYMAGQKKQINKQTIGYLNTATEGYPVNIQLVGFHAFQCDTDSHIDKDDISTAMRIIVDKVKRTEFNSKHKNIGFGLAEDILKEAAIELKGKITHSQITERFPTSTEQEIVKAVDLLLEQEIFFTPRKGQYYLRDHLFYLYLKDYYEKSLAAFDRSIRRRQPSRTRSV